MVLGYSDGGAGGLHPVCRSRVAHGSRVSTEHDVVVLSGWARVPGARPEAELMAEAWHGPAREVVVDPDARTTVDNAANALDDVRRTGLRQVVVVTSRWHAPRAASVFRWQLRGMGARVVTSAPREGLPLSACLSEVPRWLLLPAQLAVAR
ncbi:MAG: YdcF family protein [Miltoncostaeaceae bacterium]